MTRPPPKYLIRLRARYYIARDRWTSDRQATLLFNSRAAAEAVVETVRITGAQVEPL